MPVNISKKDPIIFFGVFVMKSCISMSLSFTMHVCLYVSAYKNLSPIQISTEFFIGRFTKIYQYSSFCSSGTIIDIYLTNYMNF